MKNIQFTLGIKNNFDNNNVNLNKEFKYLEFLFDLS